MRRYSGLYGSEGLNRDYLLWLEAMDVQDTVVAAVIKKFTERSEFGRKKYGTTLDRTDLGTRDWIVHAQEELMDGILYLEKLKQSFPLEEPVNEIVGDGSESKSSDSDEENDSSESKSDDVKRVIMRASFNVPKRDRDDLVTKDAPCKKRARLDPMISLENLRVTEDYSEKYRVGLS